MYVQVMSGAVADPVGLRAALEGWVRDLSGGAIGWLGATGGVTEDGTFIGLARFESEEAARRNSNRLEQGEWWAETSQLFSADITFRNCREVAILRQGGADWAGLVQVTQGRASDEDRLRRLNADFHARFPDVRPDLLGTIVAFHGDGTFTQAAYFTSEEDARAGEAQEPPSAEVQELMEAEMSLVTEATFFTLHDPWMFSPG